MLEILEHVKGSKAKKLEGELIVINDNKLMHHNVNEKWGKQDNAQMMLAKR